MSLWVRADGRGTYEAIRQLVYAAGAEREPGGLGAEGDCAYIRRVGGRLGRG